MPNKCVKDEAIRVLLDRREELKIRINKDMAEYKALGEVITRLHYAEKKLNQENKSKDKDSR